MPKLTQKELIKTIRDSLGLESSDSTTKGKAVQEAYVAQG